MDGVNIKNNAFILVAMSGGVDSSVTAALLKEQGYNVAGATFSFSNIGLPGYELLRENVNDAKKVADFLEIPHYEIDVAEQFKKNVINPFVDEYSKGRTPNPCARCNRLLKFDVLIKKAEEIGAEYVATGHYAKIIHEKDGRSRLFSAETSAKDQSYFLFNLKQEQLNKILFPLAEFSKTEIRKMATERKIPVAEKPDSQEVCFIPDDNYPKFIKDNFPDTLKPGNIVDLSGKITGEHEGIQFYTVGQRKGIGAHCKRKFVVRIDAENNEIIIGDNEDLLSGKMLIGEFNLINNPIGEKTFNAKVKIRSNSPATDCSVEFLDDGKVDVVFHSPQRAVTPGQAAVIYYDKEVIGGGFICSALPNIANRDSNR